jgi:hypothetical protein
VRRRNPGVAARNRTHGYATRDARGAKSPTYICWLNMRARCSNPNKPDWPRYGGRGIRVCDRWRSFEAFLADVGERPRSDLQLDRIDNDGHYEPGNVRWATRSEQMANRRRRAA